MPVSANNPKPLPHKSPTKNAMQPYKHGLYLDLRIGNVDSRTAVGKAHKALTGHLRQFVGESTVITELLLSRICFKTLKLYLYEAEQLNKPLDNQISVYLSISNSLRRDLAELARMAAAPKDADLMDYLKQNYGKTQIDDN